MCLPDFIRFEQVEENNPVIGYRIWKNPVKDSIELHSEYKKNYIWKSVEGPHMVLDKDSGIYAYNYNNNYNNYNNYNNNYYNNYYYYNYYNYYNYLSGIILQWGKVAIHKMGQRSEYARIDKLFIIKESDAKGPQEFLDWIKIFNERINKIAEKYECGVISWQDFIEENKK